MPIRFVLIAVLLLLFPLQAVAQNRVGPGMNAQEFDAYTQGRTLVYSYGDLIYGYEHYLPNRRVVWALSEGACVDGVWFERNGNICFIYSHNPTNEVCWRIEATENGLRTTLQSGPNAGSDIQTAVVASQTLECMATGLNS